MKGIINKLQKLRLSHYCCDDEWYSCPKSPGGCADDQSEDECNCGADRHNKILDEIIENLNDSQ